MLNQQMPDIGKFYDKIFYSSVILYLIINFSASKDF